MRLMYLGDIHGNFGLINQYISLYKLKNAHIIQVGDYGLGFATFVKEKRMLELFHKALVKNNIFVWAIRGNHDFKPYFDNDPFGFTNIKLVKDYTVLNLGEKNILCIGGAVSVDRMLRKNREQIYDDKFGINVCEGWWRDEVFILDKDKLAEFRNIDIVVTHTAPTYCPPDNTFGLGNFVNGIIKDTGDVELRTDLMIERQMLTDVFTILKLNNDIKNHYFGHFHRSDTITIYGTKHRLLGVGELFEERE